MTPTQTQADRMRTALEEIAGSKSLTATPAQFARHLQRIASEALADTNLPQLPASTEPARSDEEKLGVIRTEYEAYMADSLAQQWGVSYADWRKRYKPPPQTAPAEPMPSTASEDVPLGTLQVRALIEENRKLSTKLNEYRDKLTESEESRRELLRLLNEETGGGTFMGEPASHPTLDDLAEKMLRSVYNRPDLTAYGREQFIGEMKAGREEVTVCFGDFRIMARAAIAKPSTIASAEGANFLAGCEGGVMDATGSIRLQYESLAKANAAFEILGKTLNDAMRAAATPGDAAKGDCNCAKCKPEDIGRRMILCAKCGNKRCPHANDCALVCTNSNEPGQIGSGY